MSAQQIRVLAFLANELRTCDQLALSNYDQDIRTVAVQRAGLRRAAYRLHMVQNSKPNRAKQDEKEKWSPNLVMLVGTRPGVSTVASWQRDDLHTMRIVQPNLTHHPFPAQLADLSL